MPTIDCILDKQIIQGGMGVGVSSCALANAVSSYGQLGVISATAPDVLLLRGLEMGDESGNLRDALSHFPNQEIAGRIIEKHFIPGGKDVTKRFKFAGTPDLKYVGENEVMLGNESLENGLVAGAFVQVYLAKRGHANPVGANFLSKIAWAQLPTLYGAMLAGVDVALIGAGFPKGTPEILTAFTSGNVGRVSMPIVSEVKKDYQIILDPQRYGAAKVERPVFLAIVSTQLGVRAVTCADGYILEGPIAGGHNPPARSDVLTAIGEPTYGLKDDIDFKALNNQLMQNNTQKEGMDFKLREAQIRRNNRVQPYWLAGNYSTRLAEALSLGAQGVQVGTPFSMCQESGIMPNLKQVEIGAVLAGAVAFTDPRASPTGFPFKILNVPGTMAIKEVYEARTRICDMKYLVTHVKLPDGKIISRCPSEPQADYLRKGGTIEDTVGRKCLCNGLTTNIGFGSPGELPLVTSGGNFDAVKALVATHGNKYHARDVIDYIMKCAKS